MYTGIGASAGIGIGSAVIVKEPSLAYDNKAVSDVDAEKKRLAEALDKCIAKTQAMADDMKERVGEKEAEILEGHVLLLMDPEMTGQMETSIADDKMCAEAAVEKICDFFVGIVVFDSIRVVITPPIVSIPKDKGVTSNNNTSFTSPVKTPP